MSTLISTSTLTPLFARVYSEFSTVQGGKPTDLSMLARTFTGLQSNVATFSWLGGIPRMREWLGQRYVHGLAQRSFQVVPKDYELTIGIDRNALDDNTFVEKAEIIRGMAEQARALPNDLIFDLIKNGGTSLAFDGQYYFDTDHSVGSSGTQSNLITSAALTRATFLAARARLRSFKGENGRPYGGRERYVLVVPQALEATAIDIVGVDNIAISGGVQSNVLKGAAEILVVPELDALSNGTTTWYLFNLAGPPPFVILERQKPRLTLRDAPTDDNNYWHKQYVFGVDARYGAGYGAWMMAVKNTA